MSSALLIQSTKEFLNVLRLPITSETSSTMDYGCRAIYISNLLTAPLPGGAFERRKDCISHTSPPIGPTFLTFTHQKAEHRNITQGTVFQTIMDSITHVTCMLLVCNQYSCVCLYRFISFTQVIAKLKLQYPLDHCEISF